MVYWSRKADRLLKGGAQRVSTPEEAQFVLGRALRAIAGRGNEDPQTRAERVLLAAEQCGVPKVFFIHTAGGMIFLSGDKDILSPEGVTGYMYNVTRPSCSGADRQFFKDVKGQIIPKCLAVE